MKHILKYKNKTVPKIGDYVIVIEVESHIKEIEGVIGIICGNGIDCGSHYKFMVAFKDKDIKKIFNKINISRHFSDISESDINPLEWKGYSKYRPYDESEIYAFSSNIEDLETCLIAKKYNL